MLQNPVGEIVKRYRKKNAWSQEEFATISGIAIRTLQRIEGGEKANAETLRAIATVLKLDVTELVPLNGPIEAGAIGKAEAELREQAERLEKELHTLPRMTNGKGILTIVASFPLLNTDYPPPASEEEGAAVASLLQTVKDYADIHGDLTAADEMETIFETNRYLEELEGFGLVVFAGKLKGSVVFPAPNKDTEPLRMAQGAVFICRANEIETFNDPNNGDRKSARFHVPFGRITLC